MKTRITGVILAAGTSSRMGEVNKLLLRYGRRTVVEETLSRMMNSKVDNILVVTGFESKRIQAVLSGYMSSRVTCVCNGRYRQGRAESIKCAINHVGGHADAVLFMVADKPGVSSALIDTVIDKFLADQPSVLCVQTPAGRGHPIIFSKAIFGDLLQLKGDLVGNGLISRHQHNLVQLSDPAPQIDIDTEEDYHRALAALVHRRSVANPEAVAPGAQTVSDITGNS